MLLILIVVVGIVEVIGTAVGIVVTHVTERTGRRQAANPDTPP